MYRLIFQNRDATRSPFVGGDAPVAIGRDGTCALRLTEGGVSDQHAQIERRADGYFIRDLGSANGVRVNGQRVTEQRLAGGDQIELGAAALIFEVMHDLPVERQAFDPLQSLAFVVVALLVAGQIILYGWIFAQPHPRRGRTDVIVHRTRQQVREARAASNNVPLQLAPLPATEPAYAAAPAAEVLNRMVRILRLDRSDAADSVTLRIQVKAQVGERQLDPGSVAIGVQFFGVPAAPKEIAWLNIPADWENFSVRTFTAKFPGAPSQCAGYVVRTYYRKKLQDVNAVPATLAPTP